MIDWISIDDKTPPIGVNVLLFYYKTNRGNNGGFIVEGKLEDVALQLASERHPVEFWRSCGKGLTYFDYTERELQNLSAKNSKNKVSHWSPIINKPI